MEALGKTGQKGFRLAHIIWAVVAGLLCGALVIASKGSGHPSSLILVPPVLAIWCTGHICLWVIARLEAKGRAWRGGAGGETRSWPPGLLVALVGSGAVCCVGLVQLGGTLFVDMWYPFKGGGLWAVAMAVAVAHAICFAGLLLRLAWSRLASAALAAGWALLAVWQISEQLVHGHRIYPAELAVLLAGIAVLSFLAYHLVSSRRIRMFVGAR